MSKPKIPNQKRKYNDLSKRVTKYILLLKSIYETLNLEAAKIVESIGVSFDEKKPFSFDDFPKTKKKVENLLEKYRSEIYVLIYNSITEEWKNSNLVQDLLADSVLKAYEATIDRERRNVIYQTNSDALKSFLARKDRGMNLSDKIWLQSIEYRNSLEETISCAIEKGTSAVTLSKRVSKYMNDYPSLRRDYSRIYGKASTSYDCEYRSMRLAASEINMAYRSAENLRWQQMDFVVGYEIKLSGNHNCKGVPKGQFYDICDDLKGKYPKDFVWTGWHPLCYSDDSEVYTDSGWKLFKDVLPTDKILSLNPQTRCTEYISITSSQMYPYIGYLLHFIGKNIDCLVTPEHRMVYVADQKNEISYCKAYEFNVVDGSFITHAGDGVLIIDKGFQKKDVFYKGYVYDLTLEKNHIMYIRRNGKCFWGSNCRCYKIPILKTEEEFWSWDGRGEAPTDSINKVNDVPDKFKEWLKDNEERYERARQRGTLPYFMRENDKYTKNKG